MRGGTATTQRPRLSAADRHPRTGRATAVGAVLVILAVFLVVVAVWALTATRPPATPAVAELELEGGSLRVTGITPEVMAHPTAMPGAMMPDPVPEGMRRVSVEIVLLGESEAGLAYDGGNFRLGGAGVDPVAPERDGLGSGVVPEGSRLDGALVFEVPEDASEVTLTAGGNEGVSLALPEVPAGSQHEDGHAPDEPVGGVDVVPGTGGTQAPTP